MKFEISIPIKPLKVLQGFGVNGAYYRANGINILGHNGLDLFASHGQPVYAAHDGNAYYETDDRQGCGVVIRTNEVYDYVLDPKYSQVYFKTIYWHLCDGTKEYKFNSPINCTDLTSSGQPVKKGDLIGYADSTGFSTGDHLHFGLKPVGDGELPGTFYNIEQDNGYAGSIDPTPYLDGKYAEDVSVVLPENPVVVENLKQQVTLLQRVVELLKKLLGKK